MKSLTQNSSVIPPTRAFLARMWMRVRFGRRLDPSRPISLLTHATGALIRSLQQTITPCPSSPPCFLLCPSEDLPCINDRPHSHAHTSICVRTHTHKCPGKAPFPPARTLCPPHLHTAQSCNLQQEWKGPKKEQIKWKSGRGKRKFNCDLKCRDLLSISPHLTTGQPCHPGSLEDQFGVLSNTHQPRSTSDWPEDSQVSSWIFYPLFCPILHSLLAYLRWPARSLSPSLYCQTTQYLLCLVSSY